MENSNGGDTNVGSIENSIEEDIKMLEKLDYLLDDVYSTGLVNDEERNKYQYAIQHILSDYKRLKEDFKDIDHECDRLEKIDFEKDMKIKELQKENYSLKCQYDKALENLVKEFKVKQELKDKLKELKVKWEEMRPYRDISPHDFGYISGQIDTLIEILSNRI